MSSTCTDIMNKTSYGLMAVVVLTLFVPALAMAESENEGSESGEREAGENERSAVSNDVSNLILYVTLATIAGVSAISAITVYKVRRKAALKKLV